MSTFVVIICCVVFFFLVLILALKKMIKMAKWSKVWVSKAWVSNCLDTIVALRDPDLVSRTVVIYVATVHWTVFIRILSHPFHGFFCWNQELCWKAPSVELVEHHCTQSNLLVDVHLLLIITIQETKGAPELRPTL